MCTHTHSVGWRPEMRLWPYRCLVMHLHKVLNQVMFWNSFTDLVKLTKHARHQEQNSYSQIMPLSNSRKNQSLEQGEKQTKPNTKPPTIRNNQNKYTWLSHLDVQKVLRTCCRVLNVVFRNWYPHHIPLNFIGFVFLCLM